MKRNWVNCPICDEPDMRQEVDKEGNKLIFCVNHACLSNGGENIKDSLIKRIKINPSVFLFQRWAFYVGRGWYGFDVCDIPLDLMYQIDSLLKDIEKDTPEFKILQIKRKYNNLRIYLEGYDKEKFDGRIEELESVKINEPPR